MIWEGVVVKSWYPFNYCEIAQDFAAICVICMVTDGMVNSFGYVCTKIVYLFEVVFVSFFFIILSTVKWRLFINYNAKCDV